MRHKPLTSFRGPQGDEVIGVVWLAQALDLDFDLICGVWLQHFQDTVGFVAVRFHGFPNTFSHHPAFENSKLIFEARTSMAESF